MNLSVKKQYVLIYSLFCLVITCGFDKDPTNTNERSYYESRGEIVWEVPMNEKLIALTFDDGPNPVTTPQILDLLKKYDAKSTFFVLGKQVDRFPDLVKREAEEGHEVANHTYNHIFFNKNTRSDIITREIMKTEQRIQALTGKTSPWFRPPGGYYNDLIVNTAKKNGYTIVLWSWHQDTKDWSAPGVDKIVNKVLHNARSGDIVLFHDQSTQTVKALKRILSKLKKQGFQMVTISELLKHRRQTVKSKKEFLGTFKAPEKSIVTLHVRSSPKAAFESKLDLISPQMTQALKKARKEKANFPSSPMDIYVTIRQSGQDRHFRMESSGTLWDETALERLILPKKTAEKLLGYAEGLRKVHYGKMIPWKEVKYILPRKADFTVTDMETGLTFRVQRRAGNNHADVQPLTKEDTKIMKRMYHNRWSWKRKAVLVHSGNEWLAASMNGMPHGRGGIRDNGFPGHFCIHFFGSTTHRSKNLDLPHQLMVHKAAGKVRTFLDSASPHVLAESFVEAMYHQDTEIFQLLSEGLIREKRDFFMKEMERMMFIRTKKHEANSENITNDSLSAEVKLQLTFRRKGDKEQNTTYLFLFSRNSKQSPWRIRDILMDESDRTAIRSGIQ